MPTYEYVCSSCHRHTEAQQSFTDPPLTECEHCGGRLKRVFHPVGIVLKGSGFYSTDNRSSRRGAAADAPAKDATATTTTDKADKPSTQAETKSEAPAKTPAKSESKKAKK